MPAAAPAAAPVAAAAEESEAVRCFPLCSAPAYERADRARRRSRRRRRSSTSSSRRSTRPRSPRSSVRSRRWSRTSPSSRCVSLLFSPSHPAPTRPASCPPSPFRAWRVLTRYHVCAGEEVCRVVAPGAQGGRLEGGRGEAQKDVHGPRRDRRARVIAPSAHHRTRVEPSGNHVTIVQLILIVALSLPPLPHGGVVRLN